MYRVEELITICFCFSIHRWLYMCGSFFQPLEVCDVYDDLTKVIYLVNGTQRVGGRESFFSSLLVPPNTLKTVPNVTIETVNSIGKSKQSSSIQIFPRTSGNAVLVYYVF